MRQRIITAVAILTGLGTPMAAMGDSAVHWQDAFRQSVQRCWNPAQAADVVTVGFEMKRDGAVIGDSIRAIPREMQETDGFMAAKRAILRCGQSGYDLPQDQFDLWRNVEMTFDPEWRLGAVK